MSSRILMLVTCFASWAVSGVSRDAEANQPGRQEKRQFETVVTTKTQIGYLLYLPSNYDDKDAWPMILFLHGAGERGSDLDQVKVHGPPKLVESPEGRDFPFVVLSPQCPRREWWRPAALVALVDHIASAYKIDRDRIYVTGLSMGGFGTWALAAEYPDKWAAIVPICGGGDPKQADRMKHLPIWVFHGAKDTTVPLARSQEMVDALKAVGGNVKLTVDPDAGHDSWTKAYDPSSGLYDWLLQQRRPGSAK